jgi:hypothetical protein
MATLAEDALLARIRGWTLFFMAGLFVSGITAIPLGAELHVLVQTFAQGHPPTALGAWLLQIQSAIDDTSARYPFLFLGTDWLAFGHIVIGLGFIGLLRDPVRNEWLVTWGMIACALVIPWAWAFGWARGIPWGWRVVDSSFGVGGMVPLLIIRAHLRRLQRRQGVWAHSRCDLERGIEGAMQLSRANSSAGPLVSSDSRPEDWRNSVPQNSRGHKNNRGEESL